MEGEREPQSLIETHGYAVIKVEGGLTYTLGAPVGFDLAISGINGDVAEEILNLAVKTLKGVNISAEGVHRNSLGQLCMVVKGVLGNKTPLYGVIVGSKPANLIRKKSTVLVQLLYPDRNGFMPWEYGYSMECQKILYGEEKIKSAIKGENNAMLGGFPTSENLCIVGYTGSQSFGTEEIVLRDLDNSELRLPSRHLRVLRVTS